MLASILTYLIPVFVLGGLLVLLAGLALLSKVRGGKYVRPLANLLVKIPWVGTQMKKASRAAIERQNPELASAIRKLERSGAARDPVRAQKALSSLSASERKAYMEMAEQQGAFEEAPASNRAMRRQMAKQQKRK